MKNNSWIEYYRKKNELIEFNKRRNEQLEEYYEVHTKHVRRQVFIFVLLSFGIILLTFILFKII